MISRDLHFSTIILILVLTVLLSAGLTRIFYRYALARSLVDIPGERSSHKQPTPRGGGAAIAIAYLSALVILGSSGILQAGLVWALVGGGGLVAIVGWIDDHRHVAPLVRAAVHAGAGVWALAWLGGLPTLSVGTTELELGWTGSVLALVGIVWLTNLYNFMDGIDGIAGSQAVVTGLVAGVLLLQHGVLSLALPAWVVAAASFGFLIWNWPPARIFMGDVGSGLLGFNFAILAIATENADVLPALVWVILLAVFIVDASLTLINRMINGEKWYTAHRTHVYQRLVAYDWSHRRVTLSVVMVNVVILAPLAWIGSNEPATLAWILLGVFITGASVWYLIRRGVAIKTENTGS